VELPPRGDSTLGPHSNSHDLLVDFQNKFPNSIKRSSVGFMSPLSQPEIKNPNYKDVCTGRSGHVEVLYVELNDPKQHFEELIRFFFSFHDPTLKGRQGNDRGFQYSSWIFCGDDEQFAIAKKVRAELQAAIDQRKFTVFGTKTVETRLCDLKKFTAAGAEHQDYLAKNPTGYCNHRLRTQQWFEFEQAEKSMSKDE
jgi:peptide-methionine (S)-S-oxide reductase